MRNYTTNRKSVLLVDDDQLSNHYNKVIIQAAIKDSNIETAIDGEHALGYIMQISASLNRNEDPDVPSLIVLDVNMPRMSGVAFLSVVNGLPESIRNQISVIILTSEQDENVLKAITKYDTVKAVMQKPLCKEAFVDLATNMNLN